MGPYYEVEKIQDHETLCWVTGEGGEKQPNPRTFGMVIAADPCGVQNITAKNAEECFYRFSMYWALKGLADPPSMADITAHIGLFTNSAPMSKAQFHARFVEIARRDAGSRLFSEQSNKQ